MVDLITWTGFNCTLSTVSVGGVDVLRVTRTGANPYILSPAGRAVKTKKYREFRAMVRKHAGSSVATTFVGRLSWANGAHVMGAGYKDEIAAPAGKAIDEWFPLTWAPGDTPTAGGTDWVDNGCDQIKLEFSNDTGAVWDVLSAGEGGTGAAFYVDTDQAVPNAFTKASLDASAGPYLLPRIGLAPPNNWILLNQVTLTLSGFGDVRVEWIGQIDHGNNDYAYISLLIDNAPAFDGNGLINNWDKQVLSKAVAAYTLTCAMVHKATGLSAGSHTFSVYGQQRINATQHQVLGPTLSIDELKA